MAAAFAAAHVRPVMQWLGAGLAAQQLVAEIRRSAQAISEIVRAVKSYAYLDQAPVQDADLRASLEDTLVILRHKLKDGVERDFEAGLPTIEAYASELNQVWTKSHRQRHPRGRTAAAFSSCGRAASGATWR